MVSVYSPYLRSNGNVYKISGYTPPAASCKRIAFLDTFKDQKSVRAKTMGVVHW